MINIKPSLYLLAFPLGSIAIIQTIFALLSLLLFKDQQGENFFICAFPILVVSGLLIRAINQKYIFQIDPHNALFYAVITWVSCGICAAFPIQVIAHTSFTDAVFESISALTTTGATILTGLDEMPRSFLLYRQFLQWFGGLGVVIFVVAVLPMLNVGGMKLAMAETPGPIKNEKITPRIENTAKYLWFIYLAITVLCALSYNLAGMSFFDAIAHSFATVSTGGFSTHDASMSFFNSPLLMLIADVFMLLGAISFALHFQFSKNWNLSRYWQDEETRTFILIVLSLTLLIVFILISNGVYESFFTTVSQALFHLISFITSTGFAAGSFTDWPAATGFILIFAGYLGGCAGSTAGGNKIIRNILSVKLIALEVKRLIHPQGVFMVRYQGKSVDSGILSATVAFMSIVAFISLALTVALMETGLDFWSSLSAVAACLNVLGPGFGELGNNFQPVTDAGTWILSAAMILGRLEYFTVLALFLPSFWRY